MLQTDRGDVHAEHVVVATLMPFLDRGGHFARAYPSRSYVVTARVRGGLPEAMLHAAAPPMYSIRSVPFRGEELLMVLGQSHHLGSPKAKPDRYEKVAVFASAIGTWIRSSTGGPRRTTAPTTVCPTSARVTPRSQRVYVATGFKKWGMTGGTLAGMLITDAIMGRDNPWAPMFSSTRVKPLAEGPRFLNENARVGFRFFADVCWPGAGATSPTSHRVRVGSSPRTVRRWRMVRSSTGPPPSRWRSDPPVPRCDGSELPARDTAKPRHGHVHDKHRAGGDRLGLPGCSGPSQRRRPAEPDFLDAVGVVHQRWVSQARQTDGVGEVLFQ